MTFDAVAAGFAALSARYTTALAREAVRLAAPSGDARVLDVGTGTGIVAFEAARVLSAGGAVLGIDVSEAMLVEARRRAAEAEVRCVAFRRMDAERLELADASFDVVASLFSFHHWTDPGAAMAEIRRVLRPGGTLVIGVGGGPRWSSAAAWRESARHAWGRWREATGRRLTAPGLLEGILAARGMSVASHGPGVSVRTALMTAGFSAIRHGWRGERYVVATPGAFWEVQRTFSTPAREFLAAAPPAVQREVEAEFVARCERVRKRGGELIYPCAAHFFHATRP